jgi:hypothetical protein
MRRAATVLIALAIAAVGFMGSAVTRPAHALDFWCWDDPIVEINGQRVAIDIGVRPGHLPLVTGADVVITVPRGATTRVVYLETTYFTPNVRFVEASKAGGRGTPVTVEVTLRSTRTFDYQLLITRPEVSGTIAKNLFALSNRPVRLSFTLPR